MGMEEIKVFISNPYTFLGFGIAAFGGVWWFKMSPITANMTLVFGVLLIVLSAFLHPVLSVNPMPVRALWTLAIGSTLGLIAYYTLWAVFVPLTLHASTSAAIKPAGVNIGGIQWSPKFADVRINIGNNSNIDFEKIDLVLKSAVPIKEGGQATNIPGVSFGYHSIPTITPEIINQAGQRVSIPVVPLASTIGYRVRCDVLPKNSHIEVVLAIVNINNIQHLRDEDMIFAINFSDATSFWFVHKDYSDVVFADRPDVHHIMVTGQYSVGGRVHNVSKKMDVTDHIAGIMPQIMSQ